jgi:hypothetical protein
VKIRPVGAELFHANGQTGRHDEADSRFSFLHTRLERIVNSMGGCEVDSSGSGEGPLEGCCEDCDGCINCIEVLD